MSDQPPVTPTEDKSVLVALPPPPPEPVEVTAQPWTEQISNALRQIVLAATLIAGTLATAGVVGAGEWVKRLGVALGLIGPFVSIIAGLVAIGVIIFGVVKTGKKAADLKTLTKLLPDDYAKFK